MKAKAELHDSQHSFGTPLDWAWLLGLALVTFAYAFRPIAAVDFFWHLAIGREIATSGAIPTQDMFSAVHPESSWVQFQWLWEYLAYLCVSTLGLEGLRLVQAVLMASSTALAFWTFRKCVSTKLAALLGLGLLLLFTDRFRLRPDAVNYVFFALSLPYLLYGWRDWGKKAVTYAAVLALLWGNIHGGAALLWIASIGALWTGELVRGPGASKHFKELSLTLICVVLAIALSPTTIPGIAHFVSIFGAATTKIPNPEWMPSWTMVLYGYHPHNILVASLPYLVELFYGWSLFHQWKAKREEAINWGQHLLCGGYLFLGHFWVRTAFLSILPLAFLLRQHGKKLPKKVVYGLVVLLALSSFHYIVMDKRSGPANFVEMMSYDLSPTVHPVLAADFLEEAAIEGKIINQGQWGGYLIWRRYPHSQVFFDTRHNMREDMWPVLQMSQGIPTRTQAMNRAFEAYGTELAVYKHGGEPFNAPPDGWTTLFKAGPQVVYQHLQGPHASANRDKAAAWHAAQRQTGMNPAQQWLDDPWRAEKFLQTQAESLSSNPHKKVVALSRNGRRLYLAERYQDALNLFSQGLAEFPTPHPSNVAATRAHHQLNLLVAAAEAALGKKDEARTRVRRSWAAGAAGLTKWLQRDLRPLAPRSP